MANLNEETKQIEKKTWVRARQIVIEYAYGQDPQLRFMVENATLENGTVFSSVFAGPKVVGFNNLATFPLLNPADDSVIPDAALLTLPRHQQIQILIYSMFMDEMKK